MITFVKEKKLVMGFYFITLLTLLLGIVDNLPLFDNLIKIKYIYIAVIAYFVIKNNYIVFNKKMGLVVGILLLHTVMFGKIFTNPMIKDITATHFNELIVVYLTVIFTCMYIFKADCYLEFLEASFAALGIFFMWCVLTHFGDFVNPIYYVNIFSKAERFRGDFGLGDVNYCGNYCLYLIIVIVFLFNEWKIRGLKPSKEKKIMVYGIAFVCLNILLSTASRSAILSLLLFFGVYGFLQYGNRLIKYKNVIIVSTILVIILVTAGLVVTGKLSEIWSASNREGNFSINYPIFQYFGRWITGMGYADNSAFLVKAYGFETTAMDIYYVYIWFATGYLGALVILLVILLLLFNFIQKRSESRRNLVLAFYIMLLFYAIWQVNFLNYRYFTGIIQMIILFSFLLQQDSNKNRTLVLKWR